MAQVDLLRKYKSLFSTTLSSSISTGTGDTLTLASVTGLPTDTEITITLDRVDSNGVATPALLERITGTISGSNLTVYTRGIDGTTEQAHSSGAVIEMIWNADDLNDIIDAILVGHTQAGLHDLNGGKMILDADADTSVTADTDDRIDLEIAGADAFSFTATNIQGATQVDPWRTIDLPASAWSPATTLPCADIATVEAATNDIDYKVLDFDTAADEEAFVNFQMPESWDAGIIQFRYTWTNAAGLTTETVAFELSGRSFADNDAIDQVVGTAIEVSDTWIAQNDIHTSAWSADLTLSGTPVAGEWIHLEILRDVSSDNLTGDARLIGVQLRYKQAAFSD